LCVAIRTKEKRLARGPASLEVEESSCRNADILVGNPTDSQLSPHRSTKYLASVALNRHNHASSLIAAGVDVLTISRRLGHASPSITLDVYGNLFKNIDDRAAQVIEALFGKVRGSQ
jgi:integrase